MKAVVKTDSFNTQQRPRICLMGASLDTNNRGVLALASSLVKLVKRVSPNVNISFFEGNPDRSKRIIGPAGNEISVEIINYRLSPRARVGENLLFLLLLAFVARLAPSRSCGKKLIHSNDRLRELDDCDFVGNINGGDSFSDIYGLGRLVLGLIPTAIIILLGKKLVLLPQTYGPYHARLARSIAKWVILNASMVLSRDRESIMLIKDQLGVKLSDHQIAFCPDVAFTLPSVFLPKLELYPPTDVLTKEPFIGINVNGLMFQGGYTGKNMFGLRYEYKTFILNLIEKLITENDCLIALIPHTYGERGNVNSDPEAASLIYDALKDKCKNRLYRVTGEYDQFEIKGIIGQCDFFIGSRMHACIAAISQNVPTAAIAYSKKFSGVFESIGLEHMVVDARLLDMDESINRVMALYQRRFFDRAAISDSIVSAKEQVNENFIRFLKSL